MKHLIEIEEPEKVDDVEKRDFHRKAFVDNLKKAIQKGDIDIRDAAREIFGNQQEDEVQNINTLEG